MIHRSLRIDPLAPELCLREMLEHDPDAWLVEINRVVVDARILPPALHEEVRRRGLVRWLRPPPATSPRQIRHTTTHPPVHHQLLLLGTLSSPPARNRDPADLTQTPV